MLDGLQKALHVLKFVPDSRFLDQSKRSLYILGIEGKFYSSESSNLQLMEVIKHSVLREVLTLNISTIEETPIFRLGIVITIIPYAFFVPN